MLIIISTAFATDNQIVNDGNYVVSNVNIEIKNDTVRAIQVDEFVEIVSTENISQLLEDKVIYSEVKATNSNRVKSGIGVCITIILLLAII